MLANPYPPLPDWRVRRLHDRSGAIRTRRLSIFLQDLRIEPLLSGAGLWHHHSGRAPSRVVGHWRHRTKSRGNVRHQDGQEERRATCRLWLQCRSGMFGATENV